MRFWALRVLEFWILSELRGAWARSPPLRPLSWTRGGKGVCVDSPLLFLFFPFFVVFAAAHVVLEGPPRDLAEAGPGWSRPPWEEWLPGSPSRAEGWSPPCLDRIFLSSVCVGVAGTPKALLRQWTFLGGGALLHGSPPTVLTRTLFPQAPLSLSLSLFYPSLAGPWGPALDSETRCPFSFRGSAFRSEGGMDDGETS